MKNTYKVTIKVDGVRASQKMIGDSAADVRKDIKVSMPDATIVNIELVG
jgi:hypothetical protein